MAEKLTAQQLQAVTDRGGKLLVSAAAGSGKTKVLVDRLMSYLTDPADPANIDDFLIITYTKAAAAELRDKIATKLTERIAENPANRHLQQQIQRLYLTKISTVHSFCTDILREYAYRLDIAADFRVADENECRELQARVLEQLLENSYALIEQDPNLRAFIDSQGFGRDDRMIPLIILKVYNRAKCNLNPDKWLAECDASSCTEGLTDASQTIWGKCLLDDLRRYLDLNVEAIRNCIAKASLVDGMEKPIALLESTVTQLLYLRNCTTWDDVVGNKDIDFGRMTFPKNCTDLELIDRIKAVREACKKGLEKKMRSFADGSEQILADLQESSGAIKGLIGLVQRFEQEYDRLKRSRRVLDFGDLEHRMLDLLLGKSRSAPTAIANEIGNRFREIMVDEYQDSNQVQDAIFGALTEKRQNCFMVGDVKQSIYQFRLADPSIFIEKYNTFVPVDEAKTGEGRKVLLSSNFRSGGEVISAVNDVFTTCMSKEIGGLDYTDEEMLREGIPHKLLSELAVELYGICVQEDTYAEEASFTADRITELLDGNHFVRSGDDFRPIVADDIVILLRSPGSVGYEFQLALEKRGIRCATGGSIDLLQTEEVSTLISLLQVISNPLQDIPLTAVLMSRVFGFTADDMASLRATDRKGYIYDALQNHEKGVAFCSVLNELRQEARMSRLPQLLEEICLKTYFDSIYSALPDGKERAGNIHAFLQLASDYDSAGQRDLGQFLEHLEMLREQGVSMQLEQQPGCVTIMSIHKSKGLEFPVVFLCGLSRSFNQESVREQVLCDQKLGLGLCCVDPVLRVRYPSIAKRAIAVKTVKDSISEEMRVLYVAMTRARDRLIMTYAAKNLQGELQDILLRDGMSPKELLTGYVNCPGEWILQTALKRTDAGEFIRLSGCSAEANFSEPAWHIQVVEAESLASAAVCDENEQAKLPSQIVDKLKSDLSYVYGHIPATKAPSKQTATQLKGREKDQEAAENANHEAYKGMTFRKPSFVKEQLGATEYGNAIHTFMQYVRYENCHSVENVRQEVKRLAEQRLLSEEQAQALNCDQIAAFFTSEVGSKLQDGCNVIREFKFSILDDGSRYVPGTDGESVLLQGVIDCAVIEEDGIVLLDFKSDRVTDETLSSVADNYRQQVMAYARALERIYRKPVKSAQLYFFRLNRFVSLL